MTAFGKGRVCFWASHFKLRIGKFNQTLKRAKCMNRERERERERECVCVCVRVFEGGAVCYKQHARKAQRQEAQKKHKGNLRA